MLDISLLITIGLIFLVTLIGAYLRTRIKDRCLKSFVGFNVTLERADDRIVWGVMRLEPTGLELIYPDAIQDEEHIESSYILYASEFADIQAIYRYADGLSEAERKRREQDVKRSFHPGPSRRLGRKLRNFLSTATDSLNEVVNVVLGRIQKTGGRYIVEKGDAALSRLSSHVLGQMGTISDPMLEHHIGQRMVVEILEGDVVHEHVGILQNYSADFLLFLDVQYPQKQVLTLELRADAASNYVDVDIHEKTLRVHNPGSEPLLLVGLGRDGEEQVVNVLVDGDETVELYPDLDLTGAKLHLRVVRELDLIVPRNRCAVRHRAENFKTEGVTDTLRDIIFDLGVAFSVDRRREAREARLRETLAHSPRDALAAANLGGLLLQRRELGEAEKWLRLALSMEQSLPDGGRRARMQLRELKRRLAESG